VNCDGLELATNRSGNVVFQNTGENLTESLDSIAQTKIEARKRKKAEAALTYAQDLQKLAELEQGTVEAIKRATRKIEEQVQN